MFHNESIYALLVGGISMIIAGLCNVIVNENYKESSKEIIEDVEMLRNPVDIA